MRSEIENTTPAYYACRTIVAGASRKSAYGVRTTELTCKTRISGSRPAYPSCRGGSNALPDDELGYSAFERRPSSHAKVIRLPTKAGSLARSTHRRRWRTNPGEERPQVPRFAEVPGIVRSQAVSFDFGVRERAPKSDAIVPFGRFSRGRSRWRRRFHRSCRWGGWWRWRLDRCRWKSGRSRAGPCNGSRVNGW
jgi:hypothetical protein